MIASIPPWALKVNEQSQAETGRFEVINALSQMLVRKAFDALQLNEKLVFD
jgi:hypothetical protein